MRCRFGGLACIGEPKSARGGRPIACRASCAGAAKVRVKEKQPKARAFGGEESPPVGCCRAWPSSKPAAGPAISPDPFRGWGRKPLAHIRAQREPVVSPAGTGTEYRGPEGSPGDSRSTGRPASRQENPRDRRKKHRSMEWRRAPFVEKRPSRPVACIGQAERAHRCRRRRALGSPTGCGTVCLAVSEIPARQRGSLASGRLGRSAPLARSPALVRRGFGRQRAFAVGIAAA